MVGQLRVGGGQILLVYYHLTCEDSSASGWLAFQAAGPHNHKGELIANLLHHTHHAASSWG